MSYKNKIEILDISCDQTEYKEYEELTPYNLLKNRNWRLLSRHPIASLIYNRFNEWYVYGEN